MHRGQAMLETVLALIFVTALLLVMFSLSRQLTARIIADHAAARMARARAVGFNDFMCRKVARAAAISVSGRRLWPTYDGIDEVSRVPIYLASEDEAMANGILEYELWHKIATDLDTDGGAAPSTEGTVKVPVPSLWNDEDAYIQGEANFEAHFPYYMNDEGK